MSKIFFDANILLDILLPKRANHEMAIKAYTKICDQYDTLVTSENILTTIEYIATRNGTPCHTTASFFIGLKNNFELYGFGEILDQSLAIYEENCRKGHKIDFEDLLQLECASYYECNAFITQDKGIHKLNTSIKVYQISDFIDLRADLKEK